MKKKLFRSLPLFLLTMSLNSPAFAACDPGTSWVAAWTDEYGQTTYNLEAPCVAYIGTPFNITATVTDQAFPNNNVGASWSILDNQLSIASGFWITTMDNTWQKVQQQTYTGDPADHTIEFRYIDLGQGSGAHYWTRTSIGNITAALKPLNNPPIVDAGQNVYLTRESQQQTVILGTASDPDNNPLTYRWLEGTTQLQALQPVDSLGNAPLDLGRISPLPIGRHTLILEVSDGTTTVQDSVVVSIENTPPIAAPSSAGTYHLGQDIPLDGSVADFDGDSITYRWLEGTTVLAEGILMSAAGGAPVALPEHVITGGLSLGVHTLTLEVNDGTDTVTAATEVQVIDTAAPSITPVASDTILWPPDSTMRTVTINANAQDNSGEPVMLSVLVTSNEPSKTDKDGNIIPDFSVVNIDQEAGVITLQLRATREGNGDGREYTVTITAIDGAGNSSTTKVVIRAPHDMARM